ncbi:S-methyl-5-thioribose kinase [Paenibacillus larvae]|uniref:S-methyl-5-thioribose kinase n=1 Tax=Paenibacillus larvae TaxID=1464 RepID=UPI0001695309|nr:S-methyl-5-thioribose kinase [Paenibacillus larvae]
MRSYHPFTEREAIDYARSIPQFFEAGANLACSEIGDGNLNLVFQVKDTISGKSIIVKQALPYAKVVGESWPLTLDRARIESEALKLQGRLCPDLVPKVYVYEPELALTVMEDLSDYTIMRKGLMDGNSYPLFAEHIADFLAHTLFFTSDFGMHQQEKKQLVKAFINPELCKITEDLIFDDPYTDSPNNQFEPGLAEEVQALWRDRELHMEAAILRQTFLTHAQALLHGDLHTGSIFIKPDSTKIIDPEFAYYGPMGFDIGAVIANLLLNFAGQEAWCKEDAGRIVFRTYLLETVRGLWNRLDRKFRHLWNTQTVDRMAETPGYQDWYMERLLQDTAGFAGCKMVRRIVGLAHVADIDGIEDDRKRGIAQRMALAIGTSLIKQNRRITSVEQLIDFAEAALDGSLDTANN